jgi:NADH dehydrogenase
MARVLDSAGHTLPGVAPAAIQQGKYVALVLRRRLRDRPAPPFRYRDYGTMATIGRHRAVAVCGRLRLSGYLAWLAWLLIHVVNLIEFRDRVFVLMEWAWNYFTWNRGARLITGQKRLPADADGAARGDGSSRMNFKQDGAQ